MDDGRELQRMSRGKDMCSECGSRKWYLQDGLRFCSRGHQLQGFVQFDNGEDELPDRLGPVSRREKPMKREAPQLTGPEGRALYLEALQLLLRNQILWLIRVKGYGEELESVVRDLWDLRIRGCSFLSPEEDAAAQDEKEASDSLPLQTREQISWKSRPRAQSWDPERGAGWPMPRLPETVALCYLGLQLLRTSTRHGQLLSWINAGDMPYRTVFHDLPRAMQGRMPPSYVRALKLPLRSDLAGGELSKTVMDLVLSYYLNYNMAFPELPYVPLLVQYAKLLALPVESVVATKRLATLLDSEFHFPVCSNRLLPLDHPEIRLVTLLVVATKLCFPFGKDQRSLQGYGRSYLPRFDWETWRRDMSQPPGTGGRPDGSSKFEDNAPIPEVEMKDEEDEASVSNGSGFAAIKHESPDAEIFTTENRLARISSVPARPEEDIYKEDIYRKSCQLLSRTLQPSESKTTKPALSLEFADNATYEAFGTVEDLPESATVFYKAAGDAVGLPLDILVRAVYAQEQRLLNWQKRGRGHGGTA